MAVKRKVRLNVSAGAIALIATAYFFEGYELLCLVFIAVFVHETGHYAAIRMCGGRISEIRVCAMGVVMSAELSTDYRKEIIIASAGPAASAALAAACALTARVFDYEPAYRLAGMNLALCLYNLLPFYPLDGARMLYAACAHIFGLVIADRVSCIASCIVILAALCSGIYVLLVTGTNFTLLTAAIWMLIYYCCARRGGESARYTI